MVCSLPSYLSREGAWSEVDRDTPQNLGNLSFWWEKNENVDF